MVSSNVIGYKYSLSFAHTIISASHVQQVSDACIPLSRAVLYAYVIEGPERVWERWAVERLSLQAGINADK